MPRIAVAKVIPFLELTNFFGRKSAVFSICHGITRIGAGIGGLKPQFVTFLLKYFQLESDIWKKKCTFAKNIGNYAFDGVER
jgi:hypothetical protein